MSGKIVIVENVTWFFWTSCIKKKCWNRKFDDHLWIYLSEDWLWNDTELMRMKRGLNLETINKCRYNWNCEYWSSSKNITSSICYRKWIDLPNDASSLVIKWELRLPCYVTWQEKNKSVLVNRSSEPIGTSYCWFTGRLSGIACTIDLFWITLYIHRGFAPFMSGRHTTNTWIVP